MIWIQIPINSPSTLAIPHRFAIRNEHILIGIDFLRNKYCTYDMISILKNINDSFIKFNNADIDSILNHYNIPLNTLIYISPTNGIGSMNIPASNFFHLIKFIFYTEDYKYPKSYNLGRYLLQLCILDYLVDNSDYSRTIEKYNNANTRNK